MALANLFTASEQNLSHYLASMKHLLALAALALLLPVSLLAQKPSPADAIRKLIDERAAALEPTVVALRRDFHAHPELSNREFETSKKVAAKLRSLGLEVQTGVAHTGVVALLKGGKPGPIVALRADMDALPVTEVTGLPYASTATAEYNGQKIGVMHACGHDMHTAGLLGVAELLVGIKDQVPGTVKFIFQPAEESAPAGEEGGAELMIKEGVLTNPAPEAIFGLHVVGEQSAGVIAYRSGPAMAAVDRFELIVHGKQTHGARPWQGVDPIVVTSQIITNLQHIVSREIQLTKEPAVVTIGAIHGGIRENIIPDSVKLLGTIRTYDAAMQDDIHRRIVRIAENIAEAHGATATVRIKRQYPATVNDPDLTARMVPTLERVAGPANLKVSLKATGAEDFSFFQQRIPGLYFFVGATPKGEALDTAPANHSPLFAPDESGLVLGMRALANCVFDYAALTAAKAKK